MIESKYKRVYIAGKISGTPRDEYIKKFEEAEELLLHNGYIVLNPAKMCDTLPVLRHEEYMRLTSELLKMADCLFVIDGRDDSKGVQMELLIAQKEGIPELDKNELYPYKNH